MLLTITLRALHSGSIIAWRMSSRRPWQVAQTLGGPDMISRRAFLGGTLSAATLGTCKAQTVAAIAQNAVVQTAPEPLVWPIITKLQPGIRSFVGHADTVPDVTGRIGAPPSLVIFTEGNHLM